MITRELKRRAHRFVWPSIGICVLCYFAYHLIQGERGVLSWMRMEGELEKAQKDFDLLHTEHGRLENRVKHLRDDSLSLELLEEEAKKQGFSHPRDLVAKKPSSSSPQEPTSP